VSTRFALPPGVHGDAGFSPDRRFRYWLGRTWDPALPRVAYVLLNPSAAGIRHDDATCRKLHALTRADGGGGFDLVNLFALVDTHQTGLRHPDAVGQSPEAADRWITMAVERSATVVLGWGDGNGRGAGAASRREAVRRRAREVWPLVRSHGPRCFTVNASGAPGHPLYLTSTSTPSSYVPTAGYLED